MAWIIYLAGVVGGIQQLLIGSAVLTAVGAFMCILFGAMDGEPDVRNKGFRAAGACFFIALTASLIPSTTTIYMMVGANIAEAQIADGENQEMFDKVRKLVSQKLDEALDAAQ